MADIESVVGEVDILTSETGNFDVITLAHMKKMRIEAIAGKSVTSTRSPHGRSRGLPWHRGGNIEPQVDLFVFLDGPQEQWLELMRLLLSPKWIR